MASAASPEIHFGTGFGRHLPITRIGAVARTADDCGFSALTLIDSQNFSRDVYVALAMAAVNTKGIRIGHGVTNPYTRHPSVTANATATIDELSGGRAFLGIGAGYSSVQTMGLRARPQKVFREYVQFVRAYLAGEKATWNGHSMRSGWVDRRIPIMMAAGGPKAIQLAGELGDEVIFASGDPLLTRWRLDLVERGARKAGRSLDDVPVWLRSQCYVAESKEAARYWVQAYGAQHAYGLAFYILRWKDDPDVRRLTADLERAHPGILDEIWRIYESWDVNQLERLDAPVGKLASARLLDLFQFYGTPDDICAQLEELVAVGIRRFSFTIYVLEEHDPEANLRMIAKEIMPRFNMARRGTAVGD